MTLFTLWFLCCFSFAAYADEGVYTAQKIEEMFPKSDKVLRITNLWPRDYLVHLPIEPAIPENFVLKTIPREVNHCGYFLWGPKDVLDSYDVDNPQSLTGAIFHVYTSMEMAQSGFKSFSRVDELEKQYKKEKVSGLSKKNFMWGKYPVLTFDGKWPNGRDLFNAWIGLNYCSNVLVVKLAVPLSKGRPNDEDRALWKTFLSNTNELPEPDCFLAQGFDMQSGYTHFEPNEAHLTCIAERRKRDNALQVVVFPRDKTLTCSFKKLEKGFAGTKWRRGDAIVKIFLTITKTLPEGGSNIWPNFPITVFLKPVEEFSLDAKALQVIQGVFVIQEK